MDRRWLARYLPDPRKIRDHKRLRMFGTLLQEPNLWHLNRRSVAGAMGVGVFLALLPCPGQILMAAALAVWLRINLPVAVTMVWITNPFTMTPIYFTTYQVGAWMLGIPARRFEIELSLEWLLRETGAIWLPLLVGSLTMGVLLGILTYGAVLQMWRLGVVRKRRQRIAARKTSV